LFRVHAASPLLYLYIDHERNIVEIAKRENEGFYNQFASDILLPDNPPDGLSLKEISDEESSTL
jgi:hypothetical protein